MTADSGVGSGQPDWSDAVNGEKALCDLSGALSSQADGLIQRAIHDLIWHAVKSGREESLTALMPSGPQEMRLLEAIDAYRDACVQRAVQEEHGENLRLLGQNRALQWK